MLVEVIFLKPFVFAGTVSMVTYNFNANTQMHGWVDSDLADELVAQGLAVIVV